MHLQALVSACGGIDFYKHHEWYDNVMAVSRPHFLPGPHHNQQQRIYESFSGEFGTLVISEVPPRSNHVFREQIARIGPVHRQAGHPPHPHRARKTKRQRRANTVIDTHGLARAKAVPITLNKLAHQPHLHKSSSMRSATRASRLTAGEIGYDPPWPC